MTVIAFPRSVEYQETYAFFRNPACHPANSGAGEAYERGYHGKPARPAWKKYIQPARDHFAAAYQAGQDDRRGGRILLTIA